VLVPPITLQRCCIQGAGTTRLGATNPDSQGQVSSNKLSLGFSLLVEVVIAMNSNEKEKGCVQQSTVLLNVLYMMLMS